MGQLFNAGQEHSSMAAAGGHDNPTAQLNPHLVAFLRDGVAPANSSLNNMSLQSLFGFSYGGTGNGIVNQQHKPAISPSSRTGPIPGPMTPTMSLGGPDVNLNEEKRAFHMQLQNMKRLPFADKWTGSRGQDQEAEMNKYESRTIMPFDDNGLLTRRGIDELVISEAADTGDTFL